MTTSNSPQLLDLIRSATLVDLSVTTGEDLPCSPPEGQRVAQFMMNWYTWPRGPFLEYIQVHDDHTGTHIDSPSHFTPRLETGLEHATESGSITIEQIPLEQMIGPAVVVDVRPLIQNYPRGINTHLRESPVISRQYLEEWEIKHGNFEAGEIVLFYTGWSDQYYRPYPDGFRYDRSHPAPGEEAIVHRTCEPAFTMLSHSFCMPAGMPLSKPDIAFTSGGACSPPRLTRWVMRVNV